MNQNYQQFALRSLIHDRPANRTWQRHVDIIWFNWQDAFKDYESYIDCVTTERERYEIQDERE